MNVMIDPRHISNVSYNARSNRSHPSTSPNTAPAAKNDSHDWSLSHMTRYFCNARSNTDYRPTSPNTTPATKNGSHDWSLSHMKRYLQCAEQHWLPSNITKYCTCHDKSFAWLVLNTYQTSFTMRRARGLTPTSRNTAPAKEKWHAWLMPVTYETSFTMRGATGITLQPHQKLRLPRKIAFQNLREICRKQLKRHSQCAADPNMIRTRSEHDPTMKLQNWTRPFAELTFPPSTTHFALKITACRAPAIYPDFTKYCTCHKKWHSKITKCCACHEKWLAWLMPVTYGTSFTMRGATGLTLQRHQRLRVPRKIALQNLREICRKRLKRHLQWRTISRMIRAWSDHEISKTEPVRSQSLLFPPGQQILFWKIQHFALRLSTRFYHMLRLPRKVTI